MLNINVFILFFMLLCSQAAAEEKSWIAAPNKKVDVMEVDDYKVVILDPDLYIRVFPFREREKIPVAMIDLEEGDLSDPYFLKRLIEERIPYVLFKKFLGICFLNPSAQTTNEEIASLFSSVRYHYPKIKLVSAYNPDTIDAIAPHISYLITEKKPEGYNGDFLLLKKGSELEGVL